MSADLVKRLNAQHNDLRQGAYYRPSEDPEWDATGDAAARIEELEKALADLGDWLGSRELMMQFISDTGRDYWCATECTCGFVEVTP